MGTPMASLYNWRHQLFGVYGLCLVQLNVAVTSPGVVSGLSCLLWPCTAGIT